MHNFESRLRVLQTTLNEELERTVEEFNATLNQVAALNDKIATVESMGNTANDYRDRRDTLLESLSGMADIRVVENSNGMITVTLGGRVLVERNTVTGLSTESTSSGSVLTTYPTWEGDGTEILVNNGKIKGLMEMRDESIESQIDKLDEIALALVSQLNAVHSGGYGLNGSTGINFFDSDTTGAADIALDGNILADVAMIAASADGSTGDGTVAQQISEIGESQVMSGNTLTINDYFASMMGSLGVAARESEFMSENQSLVVQQLLNQRSSVSGVSLDEEMTNLIRYQHAYEAAAQLVSVVDEMMQTLIEMV
jgi:flagellar hook-associated protein 1 FlgK